MVKWRVPVVFFAVLGVAVGCGVRGPRAVQHDGTPVKASAVTAPPTVVESAPAGHVVLVPAAIKWHPFPAGGAGTTFAVLAGDPEKSGPFVLRIRSPAGTKIPPHWHPTDEHVTVVEGTFALGMGEEFDAKAARVLPAGSYVLLPRERPHFGRSVTETIVQVRGLGPYKVFYVNPADDPRNEARNP